MNLRKNHVHDPPDDAGFPDPGLPLDFTLFVAPTGAPPAPWGWYRFFVEMEMTSWLSESSPVSAEKPR